MGGCAQVHIEQRRECEPGRGGAAPPLGPRGHRRAPRDADEGRGLRRGRRLLRRGVCVPFPRLASRHSTTFASLARRVFACAQMACSSRTGAAARGGCSRTSARRWRTARRRVWWPAAVFFGMDKSIQFCNSKSSFCNSKSSFCNSRSSLANLEFAAFGDGGCAGVPLAAHD